MTAYHPKTAITLIAHPRATVRRMGRRTQLWPRQPLSTSGQLFLNLPKVTSCLVGSANIADVIIKAVFIKRCLLRRQLSSIFSSIERNFRFKNERMRMNEVKIISQYDIKNHPRFYSHLKIYSNPEERLYCGHSLTKLIVKSRRTFTTFLRGGFAVSVGDKIFRDFPKSIFAHLLLRLRSGNDLHIIPDQSERG